MGLGSTSDHHAESLGCRREEYSLRPVKLSLDSGAAPSSFCEHPMKTAGRGANSAQDRVHGAIAQNRSRSITWAGKQEQLGGFMFRYRKSRPGNSGSWSSLQLPCGEARLRKPSGMAPPTGEGRRASVVVLPARVRLWNRGDDFLGEGWGRSDLPV